MEQGQNIKIIHILDELKYSGAETMLSSAAKHYMKEGIESSILSTGQYLGDYSSQLSKVGYKIHHIPMSINFGWKYYKLLKLYNYDLIHIHKEDNNFLYAIIGYFTSTKVIRTVHHIFPTQGLSRLKRIVERHILKYMFNIQSTSNSSSGLENEYKCYYMKNYYIPNWYNELIFYQDLGLDSTVLENMYRIPSGKRIIISLGRNTEYKNYPMLLDALAEVKKLNQDWIYVNVGRGNEDILQEHVKNLDLTNDIIFLETISDEHLRYMLNRADIYIMPSIIEGFGIAAVEAMACGLPSILTNSLGLKDFKDDTELICFVDKKASEISNAVVNYLLMDINELQDIGSNLSVIMYEKYSSSHVVPKMINYYRDILGYKK